MESNIKNDLKVGLFVVSGLAVLLTSIILLGGDQMFLKKTYMLRSRMHQVQGLAKGSVVTLAGLPVGNVRRIQFVDATLELEVFMEIDQSIQSRITEGSTAEVKTQGALGDKYVFIQPGPLDNPVIPANGLLPTASNPDFLEFLTKKGSELSNITDVIKELHILLQNLNKSGGSTTLVENFVRTSENMNRLLADVRTGSIGHLSSILRKIDQGEGSLGALINDPTVHNKLSNFLGESPRNKFLKPLIRDTIQTNEKSN